jgi:tetratricopeptide (TPR) repeat protein
MKKARDMTRSMHFILLTVLLVTLAPASSRGQAADEIYSFAESLKKDHLYEAASQQFLKFAMENADDERAPRALENAVDCLIKIGSLEDAVRVLESLIDTYANDSRRCLNEVRLGRLYQKMKKYEDAEKTFSDLIAADPDCPQIAEAFLGKGESLLALARYGESVRVLRRLVATFKDSKVAPKAYYTLATAASGMGDEKGALEALKVLSERYPRHPLSAFASLEAGKTYLALGDSASALASFEHARAFREKAIYVPAVLHGAGILEGMHRYKEAYEWLAKLLDVEGLPDPRAVFEKAIEAAFHAGAYSEVESLVRRYAKSGLAFSPVMVYYRARAELASGRYEAALEHAAELENKSPESDKARFAPRVKGAALIALGRPREAIGEFRRFASAASDSSTKVAALGELAGAYADALHDSTRALEVMMEKLDVEKRRVAADLLGVAKFAEKSRDYRRASELYRETILTFPFSSEADWAERRLRYMDAFIVIDKNEALDRMEKVAREIVSLPGEEGLIRLAEARMDILKDFDGALSLVDKALKSSKNPDVTAHALYIKGACYEGKAARALAAGDTSAAEAAYKRAAKTWDSLAKRFRESSWAGRAAYEKIILGAQVTGKVDTLEIFDTLASYPTRSERAEILVLLGDYYMKAGRKGSAASGARYYRKALRMADGLDDPPGVRLKLADALVKQGDYKEALSLAKKALADERKRTHLRAAYIAAVSLRQLRKFEDAAALFVEVAEGDPYGEMGARAQLQAADCMYMQRKFKEAVRRYTAVLDRAPTRRLQWEATYRLALCWEKLDEVEEALELMKACIGSREGGKMRGRAYKHAIEMAKAVGDDAEVGSLLEKFVAEMGEGEAAPEREELLRWYLSHEAPDKALALAEDIVAHPPEEGAGTAKALHAMALYRVGRIEEGDAAREAARKAGAGGKLLWDALLEKAWYLYEQKLFKRSLSVAKRLDADCPGDARCDEALFLAAMDLFGSKAFERAGEYARRFFKEYPMSPLAPKLHLKLGNVLASRNQLAEAAVHYREAASLAADSSTTFDALKHEAIAYQKMSRWKDAAGAWRELLAKFPSSPFAPEASLNIARCMMEGGDLTKAVEAYHEALPTLDDQGKARAYYWSGECYRKMRNYKAAIAEFLKVPYLVPKEVLWGVTARLKAAECYASIERFDSAEKLYQAVIDKYGAGSDWGKAAVKGLEQVRKAAEAKKKRDEKNGQPDNPRGEGAQPQKHQR